MGPIAQGFRVAALLAASVVLAAPAFAAPVGIGAFGPGDTLIDFDGLDGGGPGLENGTIVTNQFAGLGVTFSNSFGNSHADDGLGTLIGTNSDPNVLWSNQDGGASTGESVTLDFSVPVSRVGMDFFLSLGATFTLEVYAAGDVLIESLTLGGVSDGTFQIGFAGLSSATNIDYARISSQFGSSSFNFSIDDLRFDGGAVDPVPAPASLGLLGLGLAGLGLLRRRIGR